MPPSEVPAMPVRRSARRSARSAIAFTRFLVFVVAGVLLMLAATTPVAAQSTFGTLTGTVKDASGALMPGATVTATLVAPVVERTAVTDPAGDFQLPDLDAGAYRLRAHLDGFADSVREIELLARQVGRADVQLAVAGTQEAVQVTARRPVIEAERSTIDDSISGADIARLAL